MKIPCTSVDDELKKILAPFEILTAKNGERLTCAHCLADATYTVRGFCGPCYLFGDGAQDEDSRCPIVRGDVRSN